MFFNIESNFKNYFILNYYKSFIIKVFKKYNLMFDDFILVIVIYIWFFLIK